MCAGRTVFVEQYHVVDMLGKSFGARAGDREAGDVGIRDAGNLDTVGDGVMHGGRRDSAVGFKHSNN